MNDFERLQTLIGEEFHYNDIICEMTDEDEEVIINEIQGYTSDFDEAGRCQLYNAYYNYLESTLYDIWVDCDNIIVAINEN